LYCVRSKQHKNDEVGRYSSTGASNSKAERLDDPTSGIPAKEVGDERDLGHFDDESMISNVSTTISDLTKRANEHSRTNSN